MLYPATVIPLALGNQVWSDTCFQTNKGTNMSHTHTLSIILLFSTLFSAKAQETTNKTETITQQEVVEAALYGKVATIETALKQGYNSDERDPENRTALMYAAFNGQAEIVKKLIAAGADVNLQDNTGTSALMFAASAPGGTETVQLLLDAGAKINMIDSNEHFTALMWAAAEGQAENVKLLLKHKADTTLTDTDGDTAESFAAQKGHTEVVKILQASAEKKETASQE
jgi:ankyrin repeat protein